MVMNSKRRLLRQMGLASAGLGATLVAAVPLAVPAQAGDNMFSSVTNFLASPFGGKKKPSDPADGTIDYRPRPALVVPPNDSLPPPQAARPNVADWPKERDAVALRRARADSRQPAPRGDGDYAAQDDSRTVPVSNSAPGRTTSCSNMMGMPVCITTPWSNVSIPGFGDKEETAGDIRLNPNPQRQYLIDPPVDYMEAVQLPDQGQNSNDGGDTSGGVNRAAPKVDKTPPGK
jgi:hypothetical protein